MLKKTLIDQFHRSYATNGWFVAVRNAVAGVTVEQHCGSLTTLTWTASQKRL